MCDKCAELDGKIVEYLSIASKSVNEAKIRSMQVLIARAKVQKAVLHPEQTK